MNEADQAGWNGRKRFLRLVDGRRLAYIDSGTPGPAVLLLHGYTDSSRSWSLIEPHLPGYRLIMADLAGHGLSDAAPAPSLEAFCEDVIALADALGLGRVALAGHSMGAMTALRLAAMAAGRVTAVASLSGSLRPALSAHAALVGEIRALRDPIDPRSAFLEDWHRCARPVEPDFAWRIAQEAAAMPAAVWRALFAMLDTVDLSQAIGDVRAPFLLLAGEADALFGAEHRAALRHALPQAEAHLLPGHSHNPHWESPAGVAGILLPFLARSAAG